MSCALSKISAQTNNVGIAYNEAMLSLSMLEVIGYDDFTLSSFIASLAINDASE